MLRIAFSTVACPQWPLERAAVLAAQAGMDGIELRTMGFGPSEFVCDPALTSPAKVRRTLASVGVVPACVATSISLDAPIRPRVLGRVIGDQELQVRQAKRMIAMAGELECPLVRVFAGRQHDNEKMSVTRARVAERLYKIADHADRTGVSIAVENTGDFASAEELALVIEACGHPLVGAEYSIAAGSAAGDSALDAAARLGNRLRAVKIKDLKNGQPVLPGRGELDCAGLVRAADASAAAWGVFEWDEAWLGGLESADVAVPAAAGFFEECLVRGEAGRSDHEKIASGQV